MLNNVDLRLDERDELDLLSFQAGLLVVNGELITYGYIANIKEEPVHVVDLIVGTYDFELELEDKSAVKFYDFLEDEEDLKQEILKSVGLSRELENLDPSDLARLTRIETYATNSLRYVEKMFGFNSFEREESVGEHVVACSFFTINELSYPMISLVIRGVSRVQLLNKVGLMSSETCYQPKDYGKLSELLRTNGFVGFDRVLGLIEKYKELGIGLILCPYSISLMNEKEELEQAVAISFVVGNDVEEIYGADLSGLKEDVKKLISLDDN